MTYKMLVIPAAMVLAPHVREAEEGDIERMVHGDRWPERSELSFTPFHKHLTQVAYDDLGLYREDGVVNRRALRLWAALTDRKIEDFTHPLIGTFVFLGFNPYTGDTTDVPNEVAELAFQQWNTHG